MARRIEIALALALVIFAVAWVSVGLLPENCFERLEWIHLHGERYIGELEDVELSC